MSVRVMNIYLQEIGAHSYLSRLNEKAMQQITALAEAAPEVIEQTSHLAAAGAPATDWRSRLTALD